MNVKATFGWATRRSLLGVDQEVASAGGPAAGGVLLPVAC